MSHGAQPAPLQIAPKSTYRPMPIVSSLLSSAAPVALRHRTVHESFTYLTPSYISEQGATNAIVTCDCHLSLCESPRDAALQPANALDMHLVLLAAPYWWEKGEANSCQHDLILLVVDRIFCKLSFCHEREERGIKEAMGALAQFLGLARRHRAALSTVWCSGCLTATEPVLLGHRATEVKVRSTPSRLQSAESGPATCCVRPA